MMWWMCWVLITITVLHRLVGYVNIALTAVAKTCDSHKFRERDTQVCVAGLHQFLLLRFAFASGKFLCLLNMCLLCNTFHLAQQLCPLQVTLLEKTKLGHDSGSQKLHSVPALTRWFHEVPSSLSYSLVHWFQSKINIDALRSLIYTWWGSDLLPETALALLSMSSKMNILIGEAIPWFQSQNVLLVT